MKKVKTTFFGRKLGNWIVKSMLNLIQKLIYQSPFTFIEPFSRKT